MRDMARKKDVLLAESRSTRRSTRYGAFFSGIVGAQWGGVTILEGQQAQAPDVAPLHLLRPDARRVRSVSRDHTAAAHSGRCSRTRRPSTSLVAFLSWLTTDPQRSFQVNEATSTLSADADVQALQSTPYLEPFFEQSQDAVAVRHAHRGVGRDASRAGRSTRGR